MMFDFQSVSYNQLVSILLRTVNENPTHELLILTHVSHCRALKAKTSLRNCLEYAKIECIVTKTRAIV